METLYSTAGSLLLSSGVSEDSLVGAGVVSEEGSGVDSLVGAGVDSLVDVGSVVRPV